ncbi:hypothetical protein Ngar_c10730 [Candidatus Nitrososphaera gargensis Ga9.2]|uniref:Uncharacterized protein n=1 Tax=Nitrososphaera gargensis (strain Ga9.2) TaxID=1237085 RepID=K0IE24_NITGG|nr:hypothetical protein Ngar_c10730 [Candidatus Nitrososphaera gargensis Ga9.2]
MEENIGFGRARIDKEVMKRLGVVEGDINSIKSKAGDIRKMPSSLARVMNISSQNCDPNG